jgi:hypothetical protein
MNTNTPSSSSVSSAWGNGNKIMNLASRKIEGSQHTIGNSKSVESVGKSKLPTIGDVDLEDAARRAYKTMFLITVLNNREEEDGHYNKSDFTRLSAADFKSKYLKLKSEVTDIKSKYKEMNQLSPEQMMKLRMIQWAEYLNNHYPAQQRIAERQSEYETKMRESGRSDKDILHNKQFSSDHVHEEEREIEVKVKQPKDNNKAKADKSKGASDTKTADYDEKERNFLIAKLKEIGIEADPKATNEELRTLLKGKEKTKSVKVKATGSSEKDGESEKPKTETKRIKTLEGDPVNMRAYNNARSQVYDSMEHDNPWRTKISASNRLGDKIANFFKGNKNSFTREEANAKKHLQEARRILVNNNVANKDKKFKLTGPMDKYTTNEIIKYATGAKGYNDPYGAGNQFTDKEIAYIKDVISKMKPDYTWEFTVEDVYMDGELFSECESSLVNVESDELVEESAIEELQQLADLL